MGSRYISNLLLLSLLLGLDANAAGSLLRISCDGNDIGAEVYINDKFKGECPIDIQVLEGIQKLRVVKTINGSYEKVFNQDVRIGDGTVKKVEVILSAPQLNAIGQAKEKEKIRLKQIALAEEERRDEELLLKQQKAAESGDVVAMIALGDRYADSKSKNFNKEKSEEYYKKASVAGSEVADFKLRNFSYKKPSGDDYNAILEIFKAPVTNIRNVNIVGFEDVKRFIETDNFFDIPSGNGKISSSFNYESIRFDYKYFRNGKYVEFEYEVKSVSVSGDGVAAIGGLLNVESSSGLFLRKGTSKINKLISVYGRPFPLVEGNRFGFIYEAESSPDIFSSRKDTVEFSCAVLSENNKTASSEEKIVGCIDKNKAYPNMFFFKKYRWDSASGCFKQFSQNMLF